MIKPQLYGIAFTAIQEAGAGVLGVAYSVAHNATEARQLAEGQTQRILSELNRDPRKTEDVNYTRLDFGVAKRVRVVTGENLKQYRVRIEPLEDIAKKQ